MSIFFRLLYVPIDQDEPGADVFFFRYLSKSEGSPRRRGTMWGSQGSGEQGWL